MSVLEGRRVSARWVFRDTEYQVTYYISDDVLEVMVEETISTNQWKGRFEAKRNALSQPGPVLFVLTCAYLLARN